MLASGRDGTSAASEQILFEKVAEDVFHRSTGTGRSAHSRSTGTTTQPDPTVVAATVDNRHHGRGCQGLVRLSPCHVSGGRPVRSGPSVIMTCAKTYGYHPEGSSPCKGIRRKGRERLLSAEQVRRLGRALSHHEEDAPLYVVIIHPLQLTGCRRSEIVTLRWKEYRDGHLHLADSKRGPRMVWLASPAR